MPVEVVDEILNRHYNPDLGEATIREIVSIVNEIEEATGKEFIRMEMGVPGLPPSKVGIEAEIEALKRGVASRYPMLDGIKELKENASRFVKAFIDLDISPQGCVPTVGSMQGAFANFMVCGHVDEKKDTFLFIDPGFPVQKQQLMVLGFKYEAFDVYHTLEELEERLLPQLEAFKVTHVGVDRILLNSKWGALTYIADRQCIPTKTLNAYGLSFPDLTEVSKQMCGGFGYTVAIKSDGTLWAWGRNVSGQLGDGTTESRSVPTQEITKATDWKSVSASVYAGHTVGDIYVVTEKTRGQDVLYMEDLYPLSKDMLARTGAAVPFMVTECTVLV